MERRESFCAVVMVCVVVMALGGVTFGQYGGGAGTAEDPYLIYTAEQMNAIGVDPNNWDKHFLLMADIDLSAYVYDSFNLIGTGRYAYPTRSRRSVVNSLATTSGGPFRGVFDGNGHTIANFRYVGWAGEETIGLFMYVNDPNAAIRNLGLIAPDVDAWSGRRVGSLVGSLFSGTVANCYARGGAVVGEETVGGLIGAAGEFWESALGTISGCYADVTVIGTMGVGGLVGSGGRTIVNCYATGAVVGGEHVGGLLGSSDGAVENCYAAGAVIGERHVGGLVGGEYPTDAMASFWDVQASRQTTSAGGEGKTTVQMQTLLTYREWGEGGSAGVWTIDEGRDYPRLAWEKRGGTVIGALAFSDLLVGAGTAEDPYLIHTVDELVLVTSEPNEWGRHYKLMADIDLSAHPGVDFNIGWADTSYPFSGVFDGSGHTISNVTYVYEEDSDGGFFGYVARAPAGGRRRERAAHDPNVAGPAIKNLGLLDPIVDSRQGGSAGALVGGLGEGIVSHCYVQGGLILSRAWSGGLMAFNEGTVRSCYVVDATVIGHSAVGGLVGVNRGQVMNCYSTSAVIGGDAGGLIRLDYEGDTIASFWDIETSGQTYSVHGTGLTTAEMMRAETFLEAGWDFIGEVENGVEDVWWILEGEDYPRLWWELGERALR